jgi:hypothetical protein
MVIASSLLTQVVIAYHPSHRWELVTLPLSPLVLSLHASHILARVVVLLVAAG